MAVLGTPLVIIGGSYLLFKMGLGVMVAVIGFAVFAYLLGAMFDPDNYE